jgi:hypothetical protein
MVDLSAPARRFVRGQELGGVLPDSRGRLHARMSSRRAWDREGKPMEGCSFQGGHEDRRGREAIVWQAEPSNRVGVPGYEFRTVIRGTRFRAMTSTASSQLTRRGQDRGVLAVAGRRPWDCILTCIKGRALPVFRLLAWRSRAHGDALPPRRPAAVSGGGVQARLLERARHRGGDVDLPVPGVPAAHPRHRLPRLRGRSSRASRKAEPARLRQN